LEPSDNFESNYPKIQSDILPGVKTQGVVVFPKVPQSGNLKVHFEGSSDNYDLEFQPFEYDIAY
jgi:hypothetical protein